MTSPPAWLALLAPLPDDVGTCERTAMPGPALAGWQHIRLVLGSGPTGLRIAGVLLDAAGRPASVSDLVATDGARRQETAMARMEPDGQVHGTYWLTEGPLHTPRALTDAERDRLRALAGALVRRCAADDDRR